jgi:hypothetical protein
MSRLNGDKSRFHRIRKANSLRRKRNRELHEQLTAQTGGVPTGTKSVAALPDAPKKA